METELLLPTLILIAVIFVLITGVVGVVLITKHKSPAQESANKDLQNRVEKLEREIRDMKKENN